ncbi:uncharacterized protein H6S33_003762 [Morchella sextelata]|uniref:uncharacterized protein n=1 Tax=Morchella sextelata TaxID=1174677 RepID=UPI001D055911|nr:uncharacterized protein H6S33_003762 [Morchella sextelata]KAH0606101.1 hypothetical protein H6S33_003762 [Morchella sextelata]
MDMAVNKLTRLLSSGPYYPRTDIHEETRPYKVRSSTDGGWTSLSGLERKLSNHIKSKLMERSSQKLMSEPLNCGSNLSVRPSTA